MPHHEPSLYFSRKSAKIHNTTKLYFYGNLDVNDPKTVPVRKSMPNIWECLEINLDSKGLFQFYFKKIVGNLGNLRIQNWSSMDRIRLIKIEYQDTIILKGILHQTYRDSPIIHPHFTKNINEVSSKKWMNYSNFGMLKECCTRKKRRMDRENVGIASRKNEVI